MSELERKTTRENPQRKIAMAAIDQVMREHILECLSYDISTAARILHCSERTVLRRLRDGKIKARSDSPGSRGILISAKSMQEYMGEIEIPTEFWAGPPEGES